MSNIVMHVFLNDTHPLSPSPGPMGDISVHASVAAHDTTLDNSNLRGARNVPRNMISIAARDTTLEMVHPLTTTMSQVQCKLHAQTKNEEITILIPNLNLQQGIQHQQISNKSPNHSQHHTRKYTNFIRLTRV